MAPKKVVLPIISRAARAWGVEGIGQVALVRGRLKRKWLLWERCAGSPVRADAARLGFQHHVEAMVHGSGAPFPHRTQLHAGRRARVPPPPCRDGRPTGAAAPR